LLRQRLRQHDRCVASKRGRCVASKRGRREPCPFGRHWDLGERCRLGNGQPDTTGRVNVDPCGAATCLQKTPAGLNKVWATSQQPGTDQSTSDSCAKPQGESAIGSVRRAQDPGWSRRSLSRLLSLRGGDRFAPEREQSRFRRSDSGRIRCRRIWDRQPSPTGRNSGLAGNGLGAHRAQILEKAETLPPPLPRSRC
jgi:hypothetical protein